MSISKQKRFIYWLNFQGRFWPKPQRIMSVSDLKSSRRKYLAPSPSNIQNAEESYQTNFSWQKCVKLLNYAQLWIELVLPFGTTNSISIILQNMRQPHCFRNNTFHDYKGSCRGKHRIRNHYLKFREGTDLGTNFSRNLHTLF